MLLGFSWPQHAKEFSPMTFSIRLMIAISLGALFMAVPMAVPLCAALPLSTQNSFGTSPTAEISTPAKPIETIFFAVNAGQRSVLGRCNADGTCKAYLGSSGQGWLPYADRNQIGNDLMAASAPDGTRFALLSSRGG